MNSTIRGDYFRRGQAIIATITDLGPDDVAEVTWPEDGDWYGEPRVMVTRNVIPGSKAKQRGSYHKPGRPGHPRYGEVEKYLLAYTGNFQFLGDMKHIVSGKSKYDRLTDKQVDAVARCIDREKQQAKERVQSGRSLVDALPVGKTRAAVTNDGGTTTFLIIDVVDTGKWAGWAFVKQQVSDNEVRLGSQRPGESYSGQWVNLIDKVLDNPVEAVVRYGLELGVCGVCNKTLTNEESRQQGIGPVCLNRMEK